MNIIGNIIWLIFGRLYSTINYFFSGLTLYLSIIGIPLQPAILQIEFVIPLSYWLNRHFKALF
ncbi:MAG: YccF domain-containing protein [Flavobacteriales bacterium AspAUS03]